MSKIIPFPKPYPLEPYGYQFESKQQQDFDTLNRKVYDVSMTINGIKIELKRMLRVVK